MNKKLVNEANSIWCQILELYDKMEIYLTLSANQDCKNKKKSIPLKTFTSNMCVLSKLYI
ncbi:hypothetical protein MHK_008255 [Candidatus Magnetomorum sp. HK-1]|nr:hypothetical protein MHK_008255 [Candidatus Magnetomorum sp. HK-1]